MSQTIPYMGTKKYLSAAVLEATNQCHKGRVVDLFAGMGSVAEVHHRVRQVWANDVQHFSSLNNKCRLTYGENLLPTKLDNFANEIFQSNIDVLRSQTANEHDHFSNVFATADYSIFASSLQSAREADRIFENGYCCFSNRYAFTYFSLDQCFEIDSIRYLLEFLRGIGRINQQDFDWGVLCLGAAMLRCANTTGHFAQFMKPNAQNWQRVRRQFKKSILSTWQGALVELEPFGTPEWRENNHVTRSDALNALSNKSLAGEIGVVYCDPPYTNDQYSRFYHIWETLVLYDYPAVTGDGLYRTGRYTTEFSSTKRVSSAFQQLATSVASIGADIVLSYPSNGLLHEVDACPRDILCKHFKDVFIHSETSYHHSSMGASKGSQKHQVTERIYVGRHAR